MKILWLLEIGKRTNPTHNREVFIRFYLPLQYKLYVEVVAGYRVIKK